MYRKGGKTIATEVGHSLRLHTTWEDESEMVEEYDCKTFELVFRKRRTLKPTGTPCPWQYLHGEETVRSDNNGETLYESSLNPQFTRRDTRENFQWRIRNLPYEASNYSVKVEPEAQNIVVRTKNKKYFKLISVPELKMLSLVLESERLRWSHANNTLIVSYKKPAEVRNADVEDVKQLQQFKAQSGRQIFT